MQALTAELQALEQELHHPGTFCDRARLEQLLHPEFHEVGRSGLAYDRATVIDFLAGQQSRAPVASTDFSARWLGPDLALLNYGSALREADGALVQHTLRSSIWLRCGTQWRLRYHQGTPAAAPSITP
ncbi:nuclear transport factor 2 family protein [Comamonas composti]|uniref:nuclear transport factor 2 family protein n=1 Tax=Comamonas composti TaxID=408558 RepID=UPI00040804B4|nr:DUF4440 domain-containing protein [Comamonas composti]